MTRKIKYLILILFTLLCCIIIFAYVNFGYLINCFSIDFSDFRKREKNIYFSPDIDKKLQDSLIHLVESAKLRNKMFWNTEPERYSVIFCLTDTEVEKYTGNPNSQTVSLFTPVHAFVILGKPGHNVNVIAHEISHVILNTKLGYFKKNKLIPTWFDEGIALQMDYRNEIADTIFEQNYTTNIDSLKTISTPAGFFKTEWSATLRNYLIARYELKKWLINKNVDTINLFINSIEDKSVFYSEYEKLKRQ